MSNDRIRNRLKEQELELFNQKLQLSKAKQAEKSKKIEEENLLPNMIASLGPYSANFIRNPKDFKSRLKSSDPQKLYLELVNFVFMKYPVPAHFKEIWNWGGISPIGYKFHINATHGYSKFKSWFIAIAQGKSLYKEYAKKILTKRECHLLTTHKQKLNFEESMTFSIAMTFADKIDHALCLARSTLSEILCISIDTREPENSITYDFWKTVVYFFAKNPPKSLSEANDLVDYLQNAKHSNASFTMSGQTIDGLRKKTEEWHRELARVKILGNSFWNGVFLPDEKFEVESGKDTITWHFRQIKNTKELAAEGNAMRHCVLSYKDRCMNDSISIWSLSKSVNGKSAERKVTIELGNDGRIRQARGYANREVRPDERNIIRKWCSSNQLSY